MACVSPSVAWLIGLTLSFLTWHLFILGKQLVLLGLETVSAQHPGSRVRLGQEPPSPGAPGPCIPRGVWRPLFWV